VHDLQDHWVAGRRLRLRGNASSSSSHHIVLIARLVVVQRSEELMSPLLNLHRLLSVSEQLQQFVPHKLDSAAAVLEDALIRVATAASLQAFMQSNVDDAVLQQRVAALRCKLVAVRLVRNDGNCLPDSGTLSNNPTITDFCAVVAYLLHGITMVESEWLRQRAKLSAAVRAAAVAFLRLNEQLFVPVSYVLRVLSRCLPICSNSTVLSACSTGLAARGRQCVTSLAEMRYGLMGPVFTPR